MTDYCKLARNFVGKRCKNASKEIREETVRLVVEILKQIIDPNETTLKKAEGKYESFFKNYPEYVFWKLDNERCFRINICQKEENEYGEDAINLAMDALGRIKCSLGIGDWCLKFRGNLIVGLTTIGKDLFFEVDRGGLEWLNNFLVKAKALENILKSIEGGNT